MVGAGKLAWIDVSRSAGLEQRAPAESATLKLYLFATGGLYL
jgi:hypothetical protein